MRVFIGVASVCPASPYSDIDLMQLPLRLPRLRAPLSGPRATRSFHSSRFPLPNLFFFFLHLLPSRSRPALVTIPPFRNSVSKRLASREIQRGTPRPDKIGRHRFRLSGRCSPSGSRVPASTEQLLFHTIEHRDSQIRE